MEVDLGGIAKGYAIDAAAEALQAAGASSGLVDIGGDLRLFGSPSGGGKWRVEVRRPRGVEEAIILKLDPCAVTTSGDYARWFPVAGKHYSHIVDPCTGWPVPDVPSVTVVAPDATTADALATGLSVMGAAKGVALVDALPGVECMMMTRGPDGSVTRHLSRGFQDLIEAQ
jgi:thiamine biosynthesis lipoprotein